MDYIVKRAAERVSAFRQMQTADWWSELSPEGQAEYLKEHPDSKKAKEVHEKRQQEHLKRPSYKAHQDHLEKQEHPDLIRHQEDHPKNIEHLHPDAQKFFKEGHDKPGSPERKAAASGIKKLGQDILHATKEAARDNIEEWKHGVRGIGKLFAGKKLDDHEREGVKAVIKDVLITAGIIAVGGGMAHGVLAAMGHMGRDLLAETFFKTVARALVERASVETASPEAQEFAALVHEVIAESEEEEAAAKGKFPPKKVKKGGAKGKPAKKKAPPKAKSGDDEEPDDEDVSEDLDDDESDSSDDEGGSDSGSDSEELPDHDPETAQAIQQIVDFLAKFAEEGKIPKEAWMAAANEEPMEDGKIFPDGEPASEADEEEASEEDEDSDEDVNDDEDEESESDDGDGSTVEDKVKQKDPDEPPKSPKLKKSKKSESDDDDDEDSDDKEDKE